MVKLFQSCHQAYILYVNTKYKLNMIIFRHGHIFRTITTKYYMHTTSTIMHATYNACMTNNKARLLLFYKEEQDNPTTEIVTKV